MKKLKKNTFLEGAFIATFCIFLSKFLGIIYVIPFYNMIGEKGGTLYGYAYNIYNVFLTISTAGIPLAISKLTSEYNTLKMEDKKIRSYIIASKIIKFFAIVSFLICFIFAKELSNLIIGTLEGGNTIEDVTFVIRIISFALLVIPFLSIKRGYLQGHRYIKEPSWSQVIEQFVRIFVILAGCYLTIYVFKSSVKYAVGISVFAACIAGVVTYLYLSKVIRQNKSQIGLNKEVKSNKENDKEIIKKIITYSIPFIIINLANTLYSSVDMILVIKTLPKLGFTAANTEFISSVITTWGVKFNTILSSIATGLIISLIPNAVHDNVENNNKGVNDNFNKCLKIILLIVTPLSIFISQMSESFWNVFYGASTYGHMIIKYTIIITIFDCLYMVTNSLVQSINREKIIYISIIVGLLTNLVLDIPFMYLFSYFKLPAFYGATTATLIGFMVSNSISFIYLNKRLHFNYKETLKIVPRFIFSSILLIVILKLYKMFVPMENLTRLGHLLIIASSGIIAGGIYLLLNYKYVIDLLPEKIAKKLKKTVD